jgi:hypothetical protein
MLPLPIILVGLGVLGYIAFGSPASPLSPAQPVAPPTPPSGGGTPSSGGSAAPPSGTGGGGGDAVPPFVSGFGADQIQPGTPLSGIMVPLAMGEAMRNMSAHYATPPAHTAPSAHAATALAHHVGSWQHGGNPWLDESQPEWLADGQAVFRNTDGDIVYVGPWWGGPR